MYTKPTQVHAQNAYELIYPTTHAYTHMQLTYKGVHVCVCVCVCRKVLGKLHLSFISHIDCNK